MRVASTVFLMSLLVSTPLLSQTSIPFIADVAARYPAIRLTTRLSLTGSAYQYTGGKQETGKAVLQVETNGLTSIEFDFPSAPHIEQQTAFSAGRMCSWQGKDTKKHETKGPDCQRFLPWFAPMLMLSPVPASSATRSINDNGFVVRGSRNLHEITFTTQAESENAHLRSVLTGLSRLNLFFDPDSLLIASAEHDQHSDANWNSSIKVRIEYSDYHVVSGVPIPYTIERYVNGMHDLTVLIDSVSLQ